MNRLIRSCSLVVCLLAFAWLLFPTTAHAETTAPTVATFPFSDNFEGTAIGPDWATDASGAGRVELTTDDVYAGSQSIFMGQKAGGTSSANLILTIDLANQDDVFLDFWWRAVDNGSYLDRSGVFLSDNDGATWKKVWDMSIDPKAYGRAVVNVASAAAANGLTLNDHFKIRLYFNGRSIGGFIVDNVRVTTGANVVATFPIQSSFDGSTFPQGFYPRSAGIGVAEINSESPFTGNSSVFLGQKTNATVWADLTLIADLAGQEEVFLDFWWHATDNGSYLDRSGVFISDNDGVTWHKVWDMSTDPKVYGHAVVDIATAAEASGLTLNNRFRIRFYYNGRITGGFFIDDLRVTTQAEVVASPPVRADFESQTYPTGIYPVLSQDGVAEITNENPYAGSHSAFIGQKSSGTARARLWLLTDLSNQNNAYLDFWWRAVDNGSYLGDSGVYISDNYGSTWTKIYNMSNDPTVYTHAIINIAEAADAHGLTLNDHFLINIYFYGRSIGGFLIDDINLGSIDPRIRDAKLLYLPLVQR